jgi:hypothetical protein
MSFNLVRTIAICCGAVAVSICCARLASSSPSAPTSTFDTITVHRINVVEDDGTTRMVVSSKDHYPGLITHNQTLPYPQRPPSGGIIFFNDEGTEQGGLEYGGRQVGDHGENSASLAFDGYEQLEVAHIDQWQDDAGTGGGLTVSDRPGNFWLTDPAYFQWLESLTPEERQAEETRLVAEGKAGHDRFFAGSQNHEALVALRDGEGKVRLQMRVTEAGDAVIEVLDADGRVVKTAKMEDVR